MPTQFEKHGKEGAKPREPQASHDRKSKNKGQPEASQNDKIEIVGKVASQNDTNGDPTASRNDKNEIVDMKAKGEPEASQNDKIEIGEKLASQSDNRGGSEYHAVREKGSGVPCCPEVTDTAIAPVITAKVARKGQPEASQNDQTVAFEMVANQSDRKWDPMASRNDKHWIVDVKDKGEPEASQNDKIEIGEKLSSQSGTKGGTKYHVAREKDSCVQCCPEVTDTATAQVITAKVARATAPAVIERVKKADKWADIEDDEPKQCDKVGNYNADATGTNCGKGAARRTIKEGKGTTKHSDQIRNIDEDKQSVEAQFEDIITGGNAPHWQGSICTSVEAVRELVAIKKLASQHCQHKTLEVFKSIAPSVYQIEALQFVYNDMAHNKVWTKLRVRQYCELLQSRKNRNLPS